MFCGDRSVEYHCNPGYALSGNSEADCTQNGWSPQPPQCLNINECQRNNGKITIFYARFTMSNPFKYFLGGCRSSQVCIDTEGSFECQDMRGKSLNF